MCVRVFIQNHNFLPSFFFLFIFVLLQQQGGGKQRNVIVVHISFKLQKEIIITQSTYCCSYIATALLIPLHSFRSVLASPWLMGLTSVLTSQRFSGILSFHQPTLSQVSSVFPLHKAFSSFIRENSMASFQKTFPCGNTQDRFLLRAFLRKGSYN